ncbi:CotH kinase family protein [Akkermansiaceae bacterium]|nr:CotH kinase family protein [Akkermansiaceae bacterium]
MNACILSDAANQPPLILTIQGTLPIRSFDHFGEVFGKILRIALPIVFIALDLVYKVDSLYTMVLRTAFLIAVSILSLPALAEALGKVDPVQFSIERGYYKDPIVVELSTKTPGANVFYTTDGSKPSPQNELAIRGVSEARVEISETTILRVLATMEGAEPSRVFTHTYLFEEDILDQEPIPSWSKKIDQGMNPRSLKETEEMIKAKEAFQLAPTVAIWADPEDLMGEEGIYVDLSKTGKESELEASLEWIDPQNEKNAQVDCGLRVQGAGSRSQSLKKNFRLRFSKQFGEGSFKSSLFKEDGPTEFENLILRNPTHDSWAVLKHSWRNNARYINDAWVSQTHRLMGHLSVRQRWVHLFLNGRYWGIYALSERLDEHFAASHLGKKNEEMTVFNGTELRNGTRDRLNQAKTWASQALANNQASFFELERHLDVDAFIDYFILNIYAANVDWPDRNFCLIGEESETPRFRFVSWDAEMGFFQKWDGLRNLNSDDALGFRQLGDNKILFDHSGAGFWYRTLKRFPEFRMKFSDRLYEHISLGGLLSHSQASLRYRRHLNEVEPLLLLEGVRWGDAINKDAPFGIHQEKWEKLTSPESWLFGTFFPNRSRDLLQDFQKDRIFPKIMPPKQGRSPSRRLSPNKKTVHLVNPNDTGIVIYTTDGTDPREAWTGKILGQAYREPISLKNGEPVRTRVYSAGLWSALAVIPGRKK